MDRSAPLEKLEAGMPVLYGGDRFVRVTAELASAFLPGDRLLVDQSTGELLHIPAGVQALAAEAVGRAVKAFGELGNVSDAAITNFYELFARKIEDAGCWERLVEANDRDVERAKQRGRSTTRLALNGKMRADMIAGLREWRDAASLRGRIVETVQHDGWCVEQVMSGLGVIGFVFEGRPNVFADATGVLRGGNAVVFRIGSDALGTAQAFVREALDPALAGAGLPVGTITLLESVEHAAGWAMFSDSRLALAVARGSGPAVFQLGGIARAAGVPVSLHGTGGAWIVTSRTAGGDALEAAVYNSLDRKVCNSVNVCCVIRDRAADLVPRVLSALERAGRRRGFGHRLHVVSGSEGQVPNGWFSTIAEIRRAEGDVAEPVADCIEFSDLGREWEWEETPEMSLLLVESVDEAVSLFNCWSPRFIASLIGSDVAEHQRFFDTIDAPFVGNGFTRWVDGQYALNKPELGLSNWQTGRLFGRGGILSGDSVFTLRGRLRQNEIDQHR
jgi:glutamate-5-semialdehyde dehydrogenase